MGADIHLYIEYKIGDLPWKADENHVAEIGYTGYRSALSYRNYSLFAALAGVRGDGPDPKGLPSDTSEKVLEAADAWGADGHSFNYNSLKEFTSIVKKVLGNDFNEKAKPKAFFVNDVEELNSSADYDSVISYCKERVKKFKEELEAESILLDQPINTEVECRLVYWFDN